MINLDKDRTLKFIKVFKINIIGIHVPTKKDVAVKVVNKKKNVGNSSFDYEALQKEIKIMRQFKSKHIVYLIDAY